MEWAEGEGIFLYFIYYRMVAKTGAKRDKERNQFPSGDHKGDRHQKRGDKEPDRGGGKGEERAKAGRDTVSINFLTDNQRRPNFRQSKRGKNSTPSAHSIFPPTINSTILSQTKDYESTVAMAELRQRIQKQENWTVFESQTETGTWRRITDDSVHHRRF